jgi:hypothetical protein
MPVRAREAQDSKEWAASCGNAAPPCTRHVRDRYETRTSRVPAQAWPNAVLSTALITIWTAFAANPGLISPVSAKRLVSGPRRPPQSFAIRSIASPDTRRRSSAKFAEEPRCVSSASPVR